MESSHCGAEETNKANGFLLNAGHNTLSHLSYLLRQQTN